jgi:hypothetical protein
MKKFIFVIALLWSSYLSAELYFGTDGQYRHLTFRHPRHGDLYHKVPQANLIGGIKFNDYFGLEAGAHVSQMRGFRYIDIKHDIKGLHASMMVFLPMPCTLVKEASLVVGGGVSHLISTFRSPNLLKINATKMVPRLLGGIQFEAKENAVIRFSFILEQVSQMKPIRRIGIEPKDTIVFSSGIYYKF